MEIHNKTQVIQEGVVKVWGYADKGAGPDSI